jgi:hypothetical protein
MVAPANKRILLESDKGIANGLATLDGNSKIPVGQIPDQSATYVAATQKGAASGVATLDGTTKIPAAQIPDAVKPDNLGKPVGKGELVFNVRDYGAVGDGATDDTTACRNALSAVTTNGGGILYFPKGTYSLNTLYVTIGQIKIVGAGVGATTLVRRAGANIDCRILALNSTSKTFTPAPGSYLTGITVSGMSMDGNNLNVNSDVGSATVQGTICAVNVKDSTFTDLYVKNPREIGLNLYGCIGSNISGVTIDGMKGSSIVNSINIQGNNYSDGSGGTYPSIGIRVRGCRIVANWAMVGDSPAGAGIGICVIGSTDVSVVDNTADFSGEPAARGRNGWGIVFEGGGNTAMLLGRRYTAANNKAYYCAVGVGAVDSSAVSATTGLIDGLVLSGNEVHDCVEGIKAVGRNIAITGNKVSADTCILIGANKPSIEENISVTGNTLLPQVNRAIYAQKPTSAGRIDGLVISGNVIDGAAVPTKTGLGVYLQGNIQNFVVSANMIKNTAAAGIYMLSSASDAQPKNGRVIGNELTNVVRVVSDYPQYYGIASSGCTDVMVALNHIVGGANMTKGTGSVNTGKFTVFGNTGPAGVAATDETGSPAIRLGGTVTGAKGGNAAVASLLTALVSAQLVTDTTTA